MLERNLPQSLQRLLGEVHVLDGEEPGAEARYRPVVHDGGAGGRQHVNEVGEGACREQHDVRAGAGAVLLAEQADEERHEGVDREGGEGILGADGEHLAELHEGAELARLVPLGLQAGQDPLELRGGGGRGRGRRRGAREQVVEPGPEPAEEALEGGAGGGEGGREGCGRRVVVLVVLVLVVVVVRGGVGGGGGVRVLAFFRCGCGRRRGARPAAGGRGRVHRRRSGAAGAGGGGAGALGGGGRGGGGGGAGGGALAAARFHARDGRSGGAARCRA